MIYLYDAAIVDDLKKSFNPDNVPNPIVKVISPEEIVSVAAQLQSDEISLPIVALSRNQDIKYDMSRYNFTQAKKGVPAEYDSKENIIYYEKAIPIDLAYDITVLTSNQADLDEIVKELLFKYSQQYFLIIRTPYEAKRPIRFGIQIIPESGVDYDKTSKDYWEKGTLYQAIIHTTCHGCVLLSYTPRKVTQLDVNTDIKLN